MNTTMSKRILAILLAVAMVFSNLPGYSLAIEAAATESGVGSIYEDADIVAEIEEIVAMHLLYGDAAWDSSVYTYETEPDMDATGGYTDEGALSSQSLQEGLDTLKMVRYLADVNYEDTVFTNTANEGAQQASYAMALNNEMSHTPTYPSGMDSSLYSSAYTAASASNIAYGYSTPSASILCWIQDIGDSNIDSVGHRRWLLAESGTSYGLGAAVGSSGYTYSAAYVQEDYSSTVSSDYVAWPSSGAFPIQYFVNEWDDWETETAKTVWSISLGNDYATADTSEIEITLTRANSTDTSRAQTWVLNSDTTTTGDYTGTSTMHLSADNLIYGMKNTITFRPDLDTIGAIADGDVFTVTITGLSKNSVATTLSYEVDFFDLESAVETYAVRDTVTFNVTDESGNPIDGASIQITSGVNDGAVEYATATGTSGVYTADLKNNTEHNYIITAAGYATQTGTVTTTTGTQSVDVKMESAAYTLTLTVERGTSDEALEGATVVIDGVTFITDATGQISYATAAVPSTLDYTVSKSGYASSTGTINCTGTAQTETIELKPYATVQFYVTVDGEAVTGATVAATVTSTTTKTTTAGYTNTFYYYNYLTVDQNGSYTVSYDGYESVTGTFAFTANTAESHLIHVDLVTGTEATISRTITLPTIGPLTYTSANQYLTFSHSSGTNVVYSISGSVAGIVTFTSSDPNVITFNGTTAKIVGAGTTTITMTIGEYDTYKSATTSQEVTVNKASQTAPATPSGSYAENTTTGTYTYTIADTLTGAEYSKDGETWQESNVFDGLTPGTTYTFYARYAETDNYYASAASAGLSVTLPNIAISSIDLTTLVTAPVKNATPSTTNISDTQYTGTVTWNASGSTFLGGTSYTATVVLTASTGYTFAGDMSVSHTGATSVAYESATGTVTIVFPETAAKELTGIAITTVPTTTAYTYGDDFNTAGMVVTATYDDGTTAVVTDYTVTDGDDLAVGDTGVTISYGGKTATQAITVTAKSVAVVWNVEESYTYTGSALTAPTASFTDINGDTIALTVTETNSKTFTDAGDYNFTASTDNTNYTLTNDTTTATIAQATNSVTVSLADWTYSETASTPSFSATFGSEATYTYSTSATGDFTSTTQPTDAGTYYVKATVAGTDNYSAATSAAVAFTIDKAVDSITFISPDLASPQFIYGEDMIFSATATSGSEVTFTYSVDNGVTYTAVVPTDVGVYDLKATVAASDNYYGMSSYCHFSIQPATYTGTTTASGAAKYGTGGTVDLSSLIDGIDGASFGTPVVSAGSDVLSGTCSISGNILSFTFADGSANAGKTATVTIPVSSTNYADFNIVVTLTVDAKESQSITLTSITDKTYGDATFGLSASGYLGEGTITFTSSDEDVISISGTTATIVGAGEATITATIAEDDTYATASASQSVTVNKATPTVTTLNAGGITYGQTLADSALSGTASVEGDFAWDTDTTIAPTVSESGNGYAVTFTPADSDNYATVNTSATVTVAKADQTITVSDVETKSYGDADFTLTATGYSGTGAITYTSGNTGVITISGDTATIVGVGTVTITATIAASDNYNEATSTAVTVTVNQATPTISTVPTASGITYGQTLANSALTGGSATLNGETVDGTFAWNDSSIAPTVSESGNGYTVTFTPDDNTKYTTTTTTVTLTVAAASITDTTTSDIASQTVSYTGSAAVITAPTGTTVDGSAITVTYDTSACVNADTYAVDYTLSAANHADVTGSIALTIEKVDYTSTGIVETTGSAKYGNTGSVDLGAWAALTGASFGTISTSGNTDVLSGSSISGSTLSFTFADVAANVGSTATITVPVSSTNYNDFNLVITVTVADKYTATLTASGVSKDYDGVAVTLDDITKTATYNGDTVEGTWAWESVSDGDIKNAADSATYTLVFTPTNRDDYAIVSTTVNIAINRLALTIAADAQEITVGYALPTFTYTVTGLVDGEALSTEPSITCAASDGDTIGSYAITVADAAASDNYTISYTNATLTINDKATPEVSITTIGSKTYGDDVVTLSVTGYEGTGEITYTSADATVIAIDGDTATIVGAGEATITASIAEDADYKAATASETVTVSPATITITADSKSATVGDAEPTYTFTVTGLIGEETLTVEPTEATCATADMTSAGSYTITVSEDAEASDNYTIVYVSGTLTVKAVSSSGSVDVTTEDTVVETTTTTTETTTQTETTTEPVNVSIAVEAVTSDSGETVVTVSDEAISTAISEALIAATEAEASEAGIILAVEADPTATDAPTNISVVLSDESVNSLLDAEISHLTIESESVSITLDAATLQTMSETLGGSISITATDVTTSVALSDETLATVGENPVFSFSITDADGNIVSDFNGGSVTVSIPYTLGEGESAENIVVYYIDADGNLAQAMETVYDATACLATFTTSHFSSFAVVHLATADDSADATTDTAQDAVVTASSDNGGSVAVTLVVLLFGIVLLGGGVYFVLKKRNEETD